MKLIAVVPFLGAIFAASAMEIDCRMKEYQEVLEGRNINEQDVDGKTLLHRVCDNSSNHFQWCRSNAKARQILIALTRKILAHPDIDVNVHTHKRGETPLSLALFGSVEIFELLLAHPEVDPNKKVGFFQDVPLLYWAVEYRLLMQLYFLVHHPKTNLNDTKDGKTIIRMAIKKFSPEIVSFLLDKGASFRLRDHKNKTPLDFAQEELAFSQKVSQQPCWLTDACRNVVNILTAAAEDEFRREKEAGQTFFKGWLDKENSENYIRRLPKELVIEILKFYWASIASMPCAGLIKSRRSMTPRA